MQGTPKAIEIKGIVRNATVIGAQDGQAEDLINLRFMDGSWRASGDGRLVHTMSGTQYTQLYVHTNVYHHLLGVNNGTLYWFAEIGTDGTSFYPLDNTTSRTQWPEDMQDLPTAPKRLTEVVGDIWIVQTGHLLTVIDENDDFEHFVFKTGEDEYQNIVIDVNGNQTDRKLFPFGQLNFNCYSPCDPDHIYGGKDVSAVYNWGLDIYYETIKSVIKAKNQFAQPFLAIAAVKLYDGSYVYASNPVYIHPRERFNNYQREGKGFINNATLRNFYKVIIAQDGATIDRYLSGGEVTNGIEYLNTINPSQFPVCTPYGTDSSSAGSVSFNSSFDNNGDFVEGGFLNYVQRGINAYTFYCLGSDLILTIDQDIVNLMRSNEKVVSSLCIFITTEADLYKAREKDYSYEVDGLGTITHPKGTLAFENHGYFQYKYHQGDSVTVNDTYFSKTPKLRSNNDIIYDLVHSPFYLLREYKINELGELLTNPIVRLTAPKYKDILKNITEQKTLKTEALSRTTYLPKVSYQYNGRLHIANYKSYPFFGYPIDLFHLHNHSVKVQDGAWFPADADGQRVLPNIADNNDAYLQYTKNQVDITNQPSLIHAAAPFFLIRVYIETQHGDQVVCRYIPAYDPTIPVNGRVDFVEDLNPLLTYPDARAYKMEISYFYSITEDVQQNPVWVYYSNHFKLTPHPYLNIAYYFKPDLKPISLWYDINHPIDFVNPTAEDMKEFVKNQNAEEYFPNGLKVSKTDNPLFFPVENTYQVGSAEILALMSNTIAVGTGQTGAAPLYVFCKDGVYALFVDASGQMTYSNSRVLARDVCNNPRSVTPIDAGVVFTTDRGLMMIAGEQVEEIGQPAEGDVLHYTASTKVDYSKYATDALTKIAGLPSSLCDTTDFLTYLQGAIVNYNHNMRELIVTNPNKSYSYVLDREGNWSRRDYTAAEYVNNYPTSYRVAVELDDNNQPVRKFYKLDDEGDANTSLEHRKEADNQIFYLSNVIKLDSIGFKQAYRFVVRGYFEAQTGQKVGIVVEGSYDGRKWAPLGYNRKSGKFTNIGCHVSHTDVRFYRVILCGQVTGKTRIDYMEMSASGSVLNTKIR